MNSAALDDEEIARRLYRNDRLHSALPDPQAITDADIAQFHRVGFLAVQNVFTQDEVQSATDGLLHLIGGGSPEFKGIDFERGQCVDGLSPEKREQYVRKLMWFVNYDARLKAMSQHRTLLAIVERLVGTKVTMVQDMALLKPRHIGREKPWHQDAAYFPYEPPEKIIGTWTALDPATPENGCMHVIPGTHLLGPRPHQHVRNCQLPDREIDVEHDVVVPLKPGGVLFFGSLLHHGTPPNTSGDRRRALQFHFVSTECRKIDSQTHGKMFQHSSCLPGDPKGSSQPVVSQPEKDLINPSAIN